MASPRQPGRTRSIRLMIGILFVVPLVSLLALWGFAASVTLSSAIQERDYNTQDSTIGAPGEALGLQLTLERVQSFVWLASGGRLPLGPMLAQRNATDAAVKAFRRGAAAGAGVMFPAGKPTLNRFLAALNTLSHIREQINLGKMSALGAFQAYNGIVNAQYQLYNDLILVNNVPLYQQSVVSVEGGRALEMVGREIALVDGALAAGGHMTRPERVLFTETVAQQRLLMGDVLSQLNPNLRAGYARAYASQAHTAFADTENAIINNDTPRRPIPVNPATWKSVSTQFLTQFEAGANSDRILLTQGSAQVGSRLLRQVLLAGGVGLLAVVASVFLMVRFGRRITRELTGLQLGALDMAESRLPKVVDRLRRGEDVDVAAESPPLPTGRTTEIARVAEAFSSVQRTAVLAAVSQAELRKGISKVFLNLAWRSQSLLHRQLSMLDGMERKSTEPEALEDLFRLDHLTTRMRRHAEGLTILSGAVSARGWRHPVPVIDVLRGAVAEVEDYTRVNVITQAKDGIAGAAVADVIHLLAELIENATSYSPPNTPVLVTADRVANGFTVEIEDRGLGINPDELAKFNVNLASPPEFDLADSDQLGLFVVGRLAARHQIKVTLRQSPYGGTTAIVLLPHLIVIPERELLAGPAPEAAAAPAGQAALALPPPGGDANGAPGHPNGGPNGGAGRLLHTGGTSRDAGGPRHSADGPLSGAGATMPGPGTMQHGAGGTLAAPLAEDPPTQPGGLPLWPRTGQPAQTAAHPTAAHPAAAAEPVLAAEPVPAASTANTAGAAVSDGPADTHLGLPRRVRQANLAPQLRSTAPADAGGAPADTRSPAESRALMASLQQGWERGRTDGEGDDTGPAVWPPEREGGR